MSDQIFICYRRDDTAGYAGRLYDRLAARFGADRVFMDIDGIGLGTDFVEEIEKAVAACKVQIVLIGRRWLTVKDAKGNRRIDDPEDFVRLEVESALRRKIRVIPALVGGVDMPALDELPESLRPLRRRQGIQITHAGFDGDVSTLISKLEKILGEEIKEPEPEPPSAISRWWSGLSDVAKGFTTLSLVGLFIGLSFLLFSIFLSDGPEIDWTPTADLTKEVYATAISQLQTQIASGPEATPTMNPLFGTITAVIDELRRSTATPTLTPTQNRTGTVAVLFTQHAVTKTPEIDRDPTHTHTVTSSPTATLEPQNPFALQAGSPAYVANIAYPEEGCNWMGVAGQVYDSTGAPIVNLGVHLTGTLGEENIDILAITGTAPQYGEGGFEIVLSDSPMVSSGRLSLQILSDDGQPLSDKVYFDTSSDCSENLVLINMVQTSSVPFVSAVEEVTLSGKGMFIWKLNDLEDGNPETIASTAAEADLNFVLIKIAEDDKYYRHITDEGRDLLPLVIDALHIKGIQVWGWHYVRGTDPRDEALVGSNRANELELDGYVISVGNEYEMNGTQANAQQFLDILKANLTDMPIALSASRYPSYYPDFPVETFLAEVDYVMPAIYWVANDNPAEQSDKSIAEYRQLSADVEIVPIGAAFTENNWQPTSEQILEFLSAAYEADLPAVTFWEWANARNKLPADIWDSIAEFVWE